MHYAERSGPPSCMMAQEEIPEEPVKEAQIQPKEELKEIDLGTEPGSRKPIFISSQLVAQEREQLVTLLQKYRDMFVWTNDEMPGLGPGLVVHFLNVDPGMRPLVQPTRVFHTDVEAQIVQEVKKLLTVGLSNPSNTQNGFPILYL